MERKKIPSIFVTAQTKEELELIKEIKKISIDESCYVRDLVFKALRNEINARNKKIK